MAFSDPNSSQNPTTGLVAPHGWGTAVDASFNFLRGAKAGCHVTSAVGTATTTDTVLPWATELYDVNSCHDNVTNNSRITVPSGWGGLWFIGANIRETQSGTGSVFTIKLVLNATTVLAQSTSVGVAARENGHAVDTIYVLAVGDYVETWITGGSNRSSAVSSHFYAHWLHSGV